MRIAISFDVDGVLLPDPLADTVFKELGARLAREIASRQGWPLARAEEELRRRIREEFRHRLGDRDYPVEAFDWDAIFTQVGQELGATQSIDIGGMVEDFCRHPQEIPCYPEVLEVLGELRHRGARLLVVTNGYARYQVPLLRALGMASFFDRIATPDKAGYAKPTSGIYHYAFSGFEGWRKVHVGDWLLHDVYGAQQAGLEAVWFDRCLPVELDGLPQAARPSSPLMEEAMRSKLADEGRAGESLDAYRPDYVIRDLRELPPLLFS